MAKHDVDPVLRQLVRAVNDSGQAAVPVTVSLHGTTLTGMLIAQNMYFSDLVEANPLMSALERQGTVRAPARYPVTIPDAYLARHLPVRGRGRNWHAYPRRPRPASAGNNLPLSGSWEFVSNPKLCDGCLC